MSVTSIPVGPETFQTGDTALPTENIPVGKNGCTLTLDVSSMVAGQIIWFHVEIWDTVQWKGFRSDFDGPYLNKQGVLVTTNALSFGFGETYDAQGNPIPTLSQAGWQVRTTITAENGPISSSGGTLQLF